MAKQNGFDPVNAKKVDLIFHPFNKERYGT